MHSVGRVEEIAARVGQGGKEVNGRGWDITRNQIEPNKAFYAPFRFSFQVISFHAPSRICTFFISPTVLTVEKRSGNLSSGMENQALSVQEITGTLRTGKIGRCVLYYPRVTSTMDIAREEARRGAAEGTVVLADEQTAGRGRIKRAWISPAGSISMSLILRPVTAYLPYLTMLASLAVFHAIADVTGLVPALKWPNDVLIRGRKVCGILLESNVSEKGGYAIVGIGLNVNMDIGGFPEISGKATSLSAETGSEVSRVDIIRGLLEHLERLYLDNAGAVFREWRQRLNTIGRKVSVTSVNETLTGTAESVSEDGSLLLRHDDGNMTRVIAGDVTLRGE